MHRSHQDYFRMDLLLLLLIILIRKIGLMAFYTEDISTIMDMEASHLVPRTTRDNMNLSHLSQLEKERIQGHPEIRVYPKTQSHLRKIAMETCLPLLNEIKASPSLRLIFISLMTKT